MHPQTLSYVCILRRLQHFPRATCDTATPPCVVSGAHMLTLGSKPRNHDKVRHGAVDACACASLFSLLLQCSAKRSVAPRPPVPYNIALICTLMS